jgi:outer membrane protein assembly factor BamB
MKHKRYIAVVLLVLIGLMASSCSSSSLMGATSWPGVSGNEGVAYMAYAADVAAIDMIDGSLSWRYPEEPGRTTFFAAPTVDGDQLLVGDYVHTLYGLDLQNGFEKWRFEDAKDKYIAPAVATEDLILAPNADGTLYALDKQGNLVWKYATEAAIWGAPVVDGDTVFVASLDRSLYALDLSDGDLVWSIELGGSMMGSPAVSEDMVFVGTIGNNIFAVSKQTGNQVWTFETNDAVWAAPVYQDDLVYVGDLSGSIFTLESQTGKLANQISVDGSVIGAGALTEDGLVFVTENGNVLGVTKDGSKDWSRMVEGTLNQVPVVVDGTILISVYESDSPVVAFDQTGTQMWSFEMPKK